MTHAPTSAQFKDNAHKALRHAQLQKALGNVRHTVIERRAAAATGLPEFEALRDQARDIRNHVLTHLDLYLEEYERKVLDAGGHVHFAADSSEACKIVLDIAKRRGARTVTKGKSMVSEEIGLPREVRVAPRTETTDRKASVDPHAPHVVGDAASERFEASDIVTPLRECLPSHWPFCPLQCDPLPLIRPWVLHWAC